MRRFHLFELEDQPWFPAIIRDAGTAYLEFASRIAGHGAILAPHLVRAMEKGGVDRIVDLCSGGCGPLPAALDFIAKEEDRVFEATLTDLYPNRSAFERMTATQPNIEARYDSVDATAVPENLPGLRTLFSAFHHFRPESAKQVLRNAADAGQPIAVFEVVARHPLALVGILFAPLVASFVVPFLRPFRWSWIPLTYLVPVIPFLIGWDGFVSCLRCYSERELRAMTEDISASGGNPEYEWEVGPLSMAGAPFDGTYLIGTPCRERDVQ